MGEETDGLASSTSKLREEIKALSGVDIMADENTYKSTAEIITEIGEVWDQMTDVSQASLLEKLAGKTRASTVAGLIENYEVIGEVANDAANAEGSALAENERYLDSISGKVSQFQNEVQEFWYNLIDSDIVKGIVDIGTTAVDAIGDLVDSTSGKFAAAGGLAGIFFGGKSLINKASGNGGLLKSLFGVESNKEVLKQIRDSLTQKNDKDVEKESGASGFAKAWKVAAEEFNGSLQNMDVTGTTTFKGLASSSGQFFKTFWNNLSSFGKASIVIAGIGTAVTVATKIFDYFNESVEESREKAEGFADSVNTASKNISSNSSTLTSLNAEYQELSQGVSKTGENISLSTDEYTRYKEIVAQISEIMPNLTGYFNAQGEQIGFVKGQIADLNAEYQSYIQSQAKGFLVNGDDDGNTFQDTLNNFNKNSKYSFGTNFVKTFKNMFGIYDTEDLPVDTMISAYEDIQNKSREEIAKYFSDLDKDSNGQILQTESNRAKQNIQDNLGYTTREILEMTDEEFNTLQQAIASNIETLQNDNYVDMSAVTSGLIQMAYSKDEFWSAGEEIQNDITTMLSSIDADVWKTLGFETQSEVSVFVGNLINALSSNKNGIADAWNSLFELDINDMSAKQYVSKVNEYMDIIADTIGLDDTGKNQLMLSLGFDVDATDKQINALREKIETALYSGTNNLRDLTLSDLKIAADIAVDFDKKSLSWDELEQKINTYKYLGEDAVTSVNQVLENLDIGDELAKDLDSSGFEKSVDDYINKVNELQIALGKLNDGTLDKGDLKNIQELGKNLGIDVNVDNINELDDAIRQMIRSMNTDMLREFSNQFGNIDSEADRQQLESFMYEVLQLGDVVGNTQFSIDIDTERTGYENLTTAIQESVSATGLSSESVQNLRDRYADLEAQGANLDAMFEETTNGIHLNRKALNELEDAYETQKSEELEDNIDALKTKYADLTDQINVCSDAATLAQLYAQRDDVISQINDIGELAAQYDGLTSAYQNWQNVESSGNERDLYEGVISGKKTIEEEMSRGWFDDGTIAYIEMMTGQSDLATKSYFEQMEAYKQLSNTINSAGYNIWDFFTTDDSGNSTTDGLYNFIDTVKVAQEELEKEWIKVTKDADGNEQYEIDFGVNGDKAVADALGISEEVVQILLRALDDAGFEVNLDDSRTELADFETEVSSVNDRLKALGATDFTFNINSTDIDNLDEQIAEAQEAYDYLKSDECSVEVDDTDLQNAKNLIVALMYQKQSLEDDPAIMDIETNADEANSQIENTVSSLQNFKNYTDSLEIQIAVGDNTQETQENIQSIVSELNSLDGDIKAKLGLDDSEFQSAVNSVLGTEVNVDAGVNLKDEDLATINTKIAAITPKMLVECGLDSSLVDQYQEAEHTSDGEVKWNNDTTAVDTYISQHKSATGTVVWGNDTTNLIKTVTGKGIIYWEGSTEVYGTAHSDGTVKNKRYSTAIGAYTQGTDWTLPKDETALVNEIGTESIVRSGKWFPIPGGAHIENLKKGDIIFSAQQTEELIRTGKVTSGGGHGKIALASGTINSAINAYSGATGPTGNNSVKVTTSGSVSKSSPSSSKSSSNNSSSSDAQEAADEFEETLDWIEVKIARIERDIENLDQTVSATYKSWSKRNSALTDEIAKVNQEISIQQQGYQKYLEKANSVGLSETYAAKVRNGTIDIEDITDETLNEQISEYKQWYEKALDCQDAVQDLQDDLADLAKTRFDGVVQQFENILSVIEHSIDLIEGSIDQIEEEGYIVSAKMYEALKDQQESRLAELYQEHSDLQKAMDTALAEGNIEKYSDDWCVKCHVA